MIIKLKWGAGYYTPVDRNHKSVIRHICHQHSDVILREEKEEMAELANYHGITLEFGEG